VRVCDVKALIPFPKTIPFAVKEELPVPPSVTGRGVVSPIKLVISEFVPIDAAPKLDRAVAAVIPPVPPSVIGIGVVKPVKLVISELAPELAAPKLVLAAVAVIAPVPPLEIKIGTLKEIVPVVVIGPPVNPVPVATLVTLPPLEGCHDVRDPLVERNFPEFPV